MGVEKVTVISKGVGAELTAVHEKHMPSGAHKVYTVPFPRWVPPDIRRVAERLSEEEARVNWASGLTPTCAEAHDGTEPEGNQTILAQIQKAIATGDRPISTPTQLGRPYVLSLPPLRSFCDLKLHLLAFL